MRRACRRGTEVSFRISGGGEEKSTKFGTLLLRGPIMEEKKKKNTIGIGRSRNEGSMWGMASSPDHGAMPKLRAGVLYGRTS